MRKTILSVVGARPNFLKAAPLHREFLQRQGDVRSLIVHTGQHYDALMSEVFFRDLELPQPDYYLEVGSASHSVQTARAMIRFEEALQKVRPDWVVVFGDVNSTLACALVCAKEHVSLAHVEAGLRSFDRTMPEEVNRLLTDQVSDLLFVTEPAGVDNLHREGVKREKIHLTGNIMIDALMLFEEKTLRSRILSDLSLQAKTYFVMTLHRPSNVDAHDDLVQLAALVRQISEAATLVFPLHPRTRHNLEECGLLDTLRSSPGLRLIEPLGYLDFVHLMKHSQGVLSDSGGVQAETTYLGVPCLTLRRETEQPITVERGTNTLMELVPEQIVQWTRDAAAGRCKHAQTIPLWDGKAAQRIAEVILRH